MSKTPMKEFTYEGYLFYPWQGQVRFAVELVDGKLVFKAGDKKCDQYFENSRVITCHKFTENDREKFTSIEDDILAHLQWGKANEGFFQGDMIGGSRSPVWVKIVPIYKD